MPEACPNSHFHKTSVKQPIFNTYHGYFMHLLFLSHGHLPVVNTYPQHGQERGERLGMWERKREREEGGEGELKNDSGLCQRNLLRNT